MAAVTVAETEQKVLDGFGEGKLLVRSSGKGAVATDATLTTERPGPFELLAVLIHFDNTPDSITCTVTLDSALGTPPEYDNELDDFGGATTDQQRYFLPGTPIPVFPGDQIAVLAPASTGDIAYIQVITRDL